MLFKFIIMPFVGVLVRYRANYTPKTGGVHLDGEDGLAPSTPDSTSYFGMMKRVHRIEGWAGLYKGIMPSIITDLILLVVIAPISVLFNYGHIRLPIYSNIVVWTIGFAVSLIPVLLLIPMYIITNRAITTPHKLAAFDAPAALRVLLSPAERAQPLRLYLVPGVALVILLEALVGPAISLLRLATLQGLSLGPTLGAGLPMIALATVLLTPLQVMLARLTLQRLGPDSPVPIDVAPLLQNVPPVPVNAPPVYTEDVMDVRTSEAPYTGLLDCGRKIMDEEGARVLFRAWWFTPLVMLLPILTPALVPPIL
ncbi:hypothetical protein DFH09DRAFT_89219 [Mycena vulgaris]|nr:hypothetical protein DFH09DRAFT_89219 [Mycena vulgaris]